MRTESNIFPQPLVVNRLDGDMAEIIFTENITTEEKTGTQNGETETVYKYDEYRLVIPYRENLLQIITANTELWIVKAKEAEYNALAAAIREKRNALLKESDERMCIDRIGLNVPAGSTFASWLSFLRALGGAIAGEWAVYRQELRDITMQEGFPYNVTFPDKPKEV